MLNKPESQQSVTTSLGPLPTDDLPPNYLNWIVPVLILLPILCVLLYGVFFLQNWLQTNLHTHPGGWFLLAFGCVIYFFSMAIPFLPGVELGFALMMIFGWPGIIAVYLSTQLALNLSYWLGNQMTERFEQRFSSGLQGPKTPRWIKAIMRQIERFPGLVFMLLLNVPGNTVMGGAGGIAAFYGLARVLPPLRFALMALVATLPLPILLGLGLLLGPILD